MPELFTPASELNPVTATAFTSIRSSNFWLVGEGRNLRIYDGSSCTLLTSKPVFRAQGIHGIHCQSKPDTSESRCLVWGGRSICIISLSSTNDSHMKSNLKYCFLIDELLVEDWLLDAFLLPVVGKGAHAEDSCLDAVFLTAHNVLYSLQLQVDLKSAFFFKAFVSFLANGPSSVLYSAHVIVRGTGQILVACGTVFGEVLVWSCAIHTYLKESGALRRTRLLQTFYGHEGSVFGVCIAELPVDTISGQLMWLIASCSDDRTIRVWKLANLLDDDDDCKSLETTAKRFETGFGLSTPENSVRSTDCLATAMGHTSRIWSLRFIHWPGSPCKLISSGEDSTCQLWNLTKESSGATPLTYVLQKEDVFGYHVGKNIWASSVRKAKDGSHAVLTGGADARIVTYNIRPLGTGSSREGIWRWTCQLSSLRTTPVQMQSPDLVTSMDIEDFAVSRTRQVFNALRGRWKIHRVLQSATSTSPSGIFKGTASFVSRSPTDLQFQGESAYIEDGELNTETGLCLKGSRRYVYRYQEASDSITAWFVKTNNEVDVDYLFHELKFWKPPIISSDIAVSEAMFTFTAYGYHLCIEDHYTAEYIFHFRNKNLSEFSVKYIVKGPRKDYTADATYMKLLDEDHKHNSPTTLPEHNTDEKLTRIPPAGFHNDSFKSYSWIGPRDLVCSTTQGCIMHSILGSTPGPKEQALSDGQLLLREISWEFIDCFPELRSYSIVIGISGNAALFTGSSGTIFRYQASNRSVDTIIKLPRKVAGLFAEQITFSSYEYSDFTAIVASCVGGSDAYIFFLRAEDKIGSNSLNLTSLRLPKNFVVTSARFVRREDVLVLGSRNGALAFYDCYSLRRSEFVGLSSCISHVHDEDAVTSIQEIPQGDAKPTGFMLLTTGRDGKFCVHRVRVERKESLTGFTVETLHVAEPPFGPAIEGAVFDSTTNDLLLWGFRSTDFVVWNNTKQTEIMKVVCGGSHRNWAYDPYNDGSDGGNFVWTKASVCNVQMQHQASHRVLQSGGHGREIRAVASTPVPIRIEGRDEYLIATGAEDTTIRLSVVVKHQKHVPDVTRCLGLITKHNTGIQQLRWSADGRFLFSAGGCEEFYVWKIQPLPSLGIGVVCALQGPPVTESLELRVMDFDVLAVQNGRKASSMVGFVVSIVYSDSTVRVWLLNVDSTKPDFKLLSTGTYTTCCLMQSKYLQSGAHLILLTTGTDGYIALWPLSRAFFEIVFDDDDELRYTSQRVFSNRNDQIQWSQRHQIHQSSIKCLTVLHLSSTDIIVGSGGDDNALAFTRVTFNQENLTTPACATLLVPRAHASTITGIQCLDYSNPRDLVARKDSFRFVTASNDQRLKTWALDVNLEKPGVDGLAVRKQRNRYSSIADASCMELGPRQNNGDQVVMVAGIGMEIWRAEDLWLADIDPILGFVK